MKKMIAWCLTILLMTGVLAPAENMQVQAEEISITEEAMQEDIAQTREEAVSGNEAAAGVSANDTDTDTEDPEYEKPETEQENELEADLANAVITHDGMKLYAVYIGEKRGDCVLLESEGEYLLMDLGSEDAYPRVKALLQSLGVTHLSIYISHTHSDHTGGLEDGAGYEQINRDFQIDHVYLPDQSLAKPVDHSWNYGRFVSYFEKYNTRKSAAEAIHYLNVGSTFTIGNAKAEVIGPVSTNKLKKPKNPADKDADDTGDYENNNSLITKITCSAYTYLTCGDCQDEEEALLVEKYGKALKADIYKLSHHAYASGNTAEFMACVQPVYSFGESTQSTNFLTDAKGLKYRVTRKAREAAQKYGICYLTGDERRTLVYTVNASGVTMQKLNSNNQPEQALTGWVKLYGADGVYELYDYYYLGKDGKPLTGLQEIDGKKYYFGNGGCLEKGNYLKEGSKVVYNGWVKYPIGKTSYGMRYYDEKSGEMYTGLHTIKGTTYYFDPETGYRSSGLQYVDGKYYQFGNGGDLKKNTWFFDPQKKKHYAGKDGVLYVGFKTIDKEKYYFDETSCLVVGTAKEPVCEINGKYYYVSKMGKIQCNKTYVKNGTRYKFNKKGVLTKVPKVAKTNISKVSAVNGGMKLQWKKNKAVTGYEIAIATVKKGTYTKVKTIKKNKTVSAKIKNLKSGQTYYVKMRSYKKINGICFYSKYSSVKTVVVK